MRSSKTRKGASDRSAGGDTGGEGALGNWPRASAGDPVIAPGWAALTSPAPTSSTVSTLLSFDSDAAAAVVPGAAVSIAAAGVTVGGAAAACAIACAREPVDVEFPLRFERKAACVAGFGIAVHLARQLVIVGGAIDKKLHCYNLGDGVECSVVGYGFGAGTCSSTGATAACA